MEVAFEQIAAGYLLPFWAETCCGVSPQIGGNIEHNKERVANPGRADEYCIKKGCWEPDDRWYLNAIYTFVLDAYLILYIFPEHLE